MALDPKDLRVDVVVDKPLTGQWHCGPNPGWVTITHLPTLMRAQAYGESQHKARAAAMDALEFMVCAMGTRPCAWPERITNG